MTANEIKKMVLDANAKVDNCLTFLGPMTFDLFVDGEWLVSKWREPNVWEQF